MENYDITPIEERSEFEHGGKKKLNGIQFGTGEDGTKNVVAHYSDLEDGHTYKKRWWWSGRSFPIVSHSALSHKYWQRRCFYNICRGVRNFLITLSQSSVLHLFQHLF